MERSKHPRTRPALHLAALSSRVVALVLALSGLPFAPVQQALAQQPAGPLGIAVPHRYLVIYRDNSIPTDAGARVVSLGPGLGGAAATVRLIHVRQSATVAIVQASSYSDDAATLAALQAQSDVEVAVHDRIVAAHNLILHAILPATVGVTVGTPTAAYDTYYTATPQGWAVVQAGGFGSNVPGGPGGLSGPARGPWNTTLGAGVRIAVLDSGVDQNHPDIAPNLAFNLSEIDQSPMTGVPSACDDGSAQDQQGHGTWTASLAAGALGPGTGEVIGVAPAATLLNIKVLERLPDPASIAPDLATQCATGQASGMLSWVLQGIGDAVSQHANIISLSLGVLVDLDTGEGAGLQAVFDRVTYAAAQAGAVVIASAGNDGVDLSNPRYIELPAQSRGALAVVASTNPACAENLAPGAVCAAGPATLPYYSNFGSPLNAIAAPGGNLPDGPYTAVSGWVRGACSAGIAGTLDGPPTDPAHSFGCFSLGHVQYLQAMGTSASAALTSGAAALLLAANPTWTPTQVIAALRASATNTLSLTAAPQLNPAALFH